MTTLPKTGDKNYLDNEWNSQIGNSLRTHLLTPFGLRVEYDDLIEFAYELIRYPFLLRDITGKDHLVYSPSKIKEKWTVANSHDFERLCGFVWQSPFFSENLKDQLYREVGFHLANNSKEKIPKEILEDISSLKKMPEGKFYQEFLIKIAEWKKEPKGYLFDQKKQLSDKLQHFSLSSDKFFYFNSDAVSLLALDVHDKIDKSTKTSSQKIAKGLVEFIADFYKIKGRVDLRLSVSYFKAAFQKPPKANSPLLKQLPRFSKLKIFVSTK